MLQIKGEFAQHSHWASIFYNQHRQNKRHIIWIRLMVGGERSLNFVFMYSQSTLLLNKVEILNRQNG